jgi:transposase-like protein
LAGPCPGGEETGGVISSRSASVAPAGYRFPREVIAVAVRWYLRYGLSYRDVEELLSERGVDVDHVTVYRWVQTFTPEFIDAARPLRHAGGDRWFVDETYVKVAGRWTYLYRAVDQHGQVIDVLVSERRDAAAVRAFFARALKHGAAPVEVTTDLARVYPRVIDELVPAARHVLERYVTDENVKGVDGVSGCLCLGIPAHRRRLMAAACSRGQGGAPGWTNDLDRGEDRGSVGRWWAWSTAERRAEHRDWECCRAA